MGDGAAQPKWPKRPFIGFDDAQKLHWVINPNRSDAYELSDVDIATFRRVCPGCSPDRPDWLWIKSQLIFRGGQSPESVKQLSAELVLEFLKTLPDTKPRRGDIKRRDMLVPPKKLDAVRPVEPTEIVMETVRLALCLHHLQAAFQKPRYAKHVGHMFGIFASYCWSLARHMSHPRTPLRVELRKLHTTQPLWHGRNCSSFTEETWGLAESVLDGIVGWVRNTPAGRECRWDEPFEAETFHRQGMAVNAAFLNGGVNWPADEMDLLSLVVGVEWEWGKLTPPVPVTDETTTLEALRSEGTSVNVQAEVLSGGDVIANELHKRVASLEREEKKRTKRLTPTQVIRKQRLKFCCPLRHKKPNVTWAKIYSAYIEKCESDKKFKKDETASPDTLGNTCRRHCAKCSEDKP